jgi:maltooligosyltrehalose trehalohydrolase
LVTSLTSSSLVVNRTLIEPAAAANRAALRKLPVGAELVEGGAHFRVWAPRRSSVDVVIGNDTYELGDEGNGYFAALIAAASDGTRYKVRLDGGEPIPDPISRYQPEGPHGASQVVDPTRFRWTDQGWVGIEATGQVLYEMHVGTFTMEGTFAAAAERLPGLAELGITAIEVLPIAEFPGRFGWGYDGVNLFAPYHGYGAPDDFRAFVDRAHAEGIGVILDVVYNHVGPDGNYLREFAETFFSHTHTTDWGDAINYDGPGSDGVRELVLTNVRHWIEEYHLDGLRLDATQDIHDDSTPHILEEIGVTAHRAAGTRKIIVVAENEPQNARLVRPRSRGGFGLQQIWCDDFHHAATVAATGRREAYMSDYRGTAQEFVSSLKYGVLYQGQRYSWQEQRRGSPSWDVLPHQFMIYLENHDQVANSRAGKRLHQLTSPGRYRALTAVLLLAPQTPLLFQGQEFGASSPFLYFADHKPELATLVRSGRIEFMSQFPSIVAKLPEAVDDPGAEQTFDRCHLDWRERESHQMHLALHHDLIALRRRDPVLNAAGRVDGAVLGEHAFVVRLFGDTGRNRLLVVNLGPELALDVAPEPLLAPPDPERGWLRLWYSDEPSYGGRGCPSPESQDGTWRIPAESATVLAANPS